MGEDQCKPVKKDGRWRTGVTLKTSDSACCKKMLLQQLTIWNLVIFPLLGDILRAEAEIKHLPGGNLTSLTGNFETTDCRKVTLITCSSTAFGLAFVIACLIYCFRHVSRKTQDVEVASERVEDQLNVDTSGLWQHLKVLRFDLNTVHSNIVVSKNGDTALRVDDKQLYEDRPERFRKYPQVLCATPLTGRCYWEIVFTGGCEVSVCYRDVANPDECRFGLSSRSWTVVCSESGFTAVHDSQVVGRKKGPANRVAVDLDHTNGILAFYKVTFGQLVLIHRFRSTFSEPLYAGFRMWVSSSVKLCRLHNVDKHEWENVDPETSESPTSI